MPRYDSSRKSYGGLLQRPDMSRTLMGRRKRRQRALLALAALAVVAAFAAVAVARSGVLDKTSAPTQRATAATSTAEATTTAGASTPASPAASATRTAPASGPASAVIEIGWVGDTTPGSMYGNPPRDGKALFGRVREFTAAADIMVGNLEGTFGEGGKSKCDGKDTSDCYAFQAPPANAGSLAWAGFDVMNLANNHSNDYFDKGRSATTEALEANDIAYTGLNGSVAYRQVDGVKVAFLGFAPYPWTEDIGDIPAAQELVRKADEEADVVVVLMHAGAEGVEYTHVPTGAERAYGEFRGDTRAFSHAVIDAGADLVLGSGPHVVRGMEQYDGKLIAYSLGNFAGWKCFNRAGIRSLSGILTVKVAGDGTVQGGRWRSMHIDDPGVPRPDTSRKAVKLVQKLSNEDFETPVTMAEDGSFVMDMAP